MKTISLLAAAALSVATLSVLPTQQPGQAVPARDTAVPTTQLTLEIADCEGCVISLVSYVYGSTDFWNSKSRKVEDGSVTFAVPTARTLGVSMQVRTPWEGGTGFVTNVVLRYQGFQTGDRIGFRPARASKRATACWAGTTEDAVTMRVKVRRVQVRGDGGKVPGSIAWAPVTQDWLRPLVNTWRGVVGTQDAMPCKA
jgi:hypothetical protein